MGWVWFAAVVIGWPLLLLFLVRLGDTGLSL